MAFLKFGTLVALLALTSACSPETSAPKKISGTPEGAALNKCLLDRAQYFARQRGPALDLGFLAAEGCTAERWAVIRMIAPRKDVAENIEPDFFRNDVAFAAEAIILLRGY